MYIIWTEINSYQYPHEDYTASKSRKYTGGHISAQEHGYLSDVVNWRKLGDLPNVVKWLDFEDLPDMVNWLEPVDKPNVVNWLKQVDVPDMVNGLELEGIFPVSPVVKEQFPRIVGRSSLPVTLQFIV